MTRHLLTLFVAIFVVTSLPLGASAHDEALSCGPGTEFNNKAEAIKAGNSTFPVFEEIRQVTGDDVETVFQVFPNPSSHYDEVIFYYIGRPDVVFFTVWHEGCLHRYGTFPFSMYTKAMKAVEDAKEPPGDPA